MSSRELKSCWTTCPTRARSCCAAARTGAPSCDAWRDARDEAADAYRCGAPRVTRRAYAAYRAAQDREDAAQDALAHTQTSRTSVS